MRIRRTRLALAGGSLLIAATNGWLVGSAAWNRAGTPAATLRLTERELALPPFREKENTSLLLSLRLVHETPWELRYATGRRGLKPLVPEYGWLDREKLVQLGFRVALPASDPSAEQYYASAPPRRAFLAVEMDGEAWRSWLAGREQEVERVRQQVGRGGVTNGALADAEALLAADRVSRSRLFPVDADSDASALRRRYPDSARHGIVPGLVGIEVRTNDGSPPRIQGTILGAQVSSVNVPLSLRPAFEAILPRETSDEGLKRLRRESESGLPAPRAARYVAVVAYGRRLEPWLVSVDAPVASEP